MNDDEEFLRAVAIACWVVVCLISAGFFLAMWMMGDL